MANCEPPATFFIIGAEKGGTTSLHTQLSRHPDVLLSEPKEPHFFDLHFGRGYDWYAKEVFSNHAGEPAFGEATPTYLLLPYVADRIAEANPDARLIVSLRNPVDRAYSAWWMFWVRGLERLDFSDAVRLNRAEIEDGVSLYDGDLETRWRAYVDAIRGGQRLLFRTYLQGGFYAEHLRYWMKAFPRDQTKVVVADRLFRDQAQVVRELWEFLGVDPTLGNPRPEVENAAMGRYAAPILRAAQLTRAIRIAPHLPERWRMAFKRSTSWMGTRPPMQPELRKRLTEVFMPHIRDLEALTGLDLAVWRTDPYAREFI